MFINVYFKNIFKNSLANKLSFALDSKYFLKKTSIRSTKMAHSNHSQYTLPHHHLVKTNAGINMPLFIYGAAWKNEKT